MACVKGNYSINILEKTRTVFLKNFTSL